MIDNPTHSLTFGDLVWIEDGANPPDSSGIVYRVRAQDATLGTAIPVTTALMWLGRVGGPVTWDSTPNREPVFRVTIEADDSDLLARGEKALQLQAEQSCELVWTPPDGAGEPSVFDVVWSHLEPVFDRDGLTGLGMEETVVRSRTYLVRMQALPYVRAADLVVTPAAATATETVVDAGSSTSGWTAVPGSLAIVSGAIVDSYTAPAHGASAKVSTSNSTTLPDGYLAVTWKSSSPLSGIGVVLLLAGSTDPILATSVVDAGGGYFTSFYRVSPSTVTGYTLAWVPTASGSQTFSIDKVSTWTALPFIGTARQKALSLVPGGSVKTQGSIQVSHASSALGKTIVYTHPSGSGYLPPLRAWRTGGEAVTTDSTLVSGARNAIGPSSDAHELPVSALPTGRAELWAFLRATTTTGMKDVQWSVRSIMGSNILSLTTYTTPVTFAATNTWYLVCLGATVLPDVAIGPSGKVHIDMLENPVTHGIQIDESYLFATDAGSLTVVDCGTGTTAAGGPSNRLWIDAPSLDEPMGAIYRGNAADRSDQWHAGAYATPWGEHDFAPRGTSVFVATSGATDAATSLEHYQRFNTFVARDT